MATIDQVAALAGVSTATVSRALRGLGTVSEKKTQRVLAAAAKLGYVTSTTASALASGRAMTIGVVLPNVRTWYYSTVLDSIQERLTDFGFDSMLYCAGEETSHRDAIFNQLLPRKRIDGVVNIAVHLSASELAHLTKLGKPVVSLGREIESVNTICINDDEVGRIATSHLVELGHRKIGHIGGLPRSEMDLSQPNLRTDAFVDLLKQSQLPVESEWIKIADFSVQGGYEAAMAILKNADHAPTAIFCSSDEMALGAIKAAADCGLKVPDDLSVIGVDNHSLSDFYGLTTVDQHANEQGAACADVILHILSLGKGENPPEPEHRTWPVNLVMRETTAPLPRLSE